jgi:hypothetical protein
MYAKLVHQLSRIHALLLCFMHDLSASHGTSVHSALRGRSTLLPLRLASPCVCRAHVHVFPWRRAHRATGIGSLRCVGKHCCTYATRGRVCAGDRRSRPLSALHCMLFRYLAAATTCSIVCARCFFLLATSRCIQRCDVKVES